MTGLIITCWVIAGASAVLHMLAYLDLALHPVSSLLASLVGEERDEAEDGDASDIERDNPTIQLTHESSYLLRGIGIITLVVLVASVSIALAQVDVVLGILLGITIGLIFKFSANVLITFLARNYLLQLRKIVSPSVGVLNKISSFGLFSAIAGNSAILPGSRQARYIEVADFIKSGLHYLSRVHIPQEEKELRMIRGILKMDELTVREIMCPRPDIIAVPLNTPYAEVIDVMRANGVTKLPVYENSLDDVNNVKGVLFALDLLRNISQDKQGTKKTATDLTDIVRTPLFVTEFQSVENLLREFKEQRTSIALIVDEHGGIDGLVTVTDVVEEIVGEMMDEFDRDLPEVQIISPDEVVVDAGVNLGQLNQALNSDLDADVSTVGGLIYNNLDKMPRTGDLVDIGPLRMTISNMLGRRIRRVNVKRIDKTSSDN